MSKVFKQNKRQLKNQNKFIEKARKIHDNKYDYSNVVYKGVFEKVKIICPIHGEFEQTPSNHTHTNGYGCVKCGVIKQGKTKRMDVGEFIKRASKIHGGKYDYSKVIYKNNSTKVIIICPIHGEFLQRPSNHIKGVNCPKCVDTRLTTKTFIEKAKSIHGGKYDYSLVEYINNHTKVKIICPIHGEFLQQPNSHLRGSGCPWCKLENSNYIQGKYIPKFPEKYDGDVNNIIYRSSYELKAFEMIEYEIEKSDSIVLWSSEEVCIPYKINNIYHEYYVDLMIKTKYDTFLIEVKPELQTRPPKNETYYYNNKIYHMNMKKWMSAKEYCLKHGWKFKLWTERELNIQYNK